MRVLILGGGGTLGAFSAGALRMLEEHGWVPDALIGSSAGGINLLRSTVGGSAAAAEFWQSLRWRVLLWEGLRHNIFVRGLLDPVRFNARVNAGVDFEALLHEPRYIGFIVVDMSNGKVAVRGNRTEKNVDALRRIANASFALPPLLPPVRGADGHLYADGGLLQNAPLESAVALGASEIVYLCNVQVVPRQGFERASTPRSTLRYLEIFARRASNVGFADADIVEGAFRGIPFLTIAPPESVRLDSMLAWMLPSPRSMERLIASGYASASAAVACASWLRLSASPPASRPPRALDGPTLPLPTGSVRPRREAHR